MLKTCLKLLNIKTILMKKYLGVFLCNTNDRIRIQIRLQVINSYPRPAKIPKFGFGRIRIHISDGSNYTIIFKTNDSHGTVLVLQTFYNWVLVHQTTGTGTVSNVVDPNTLNFNPDPGFWPNLHPDPGLYNQFWKKKFKIILEKNNFLWIKYIFLITGVP